MPYTFCPTVQTGDDIVVSAPVTLGASGRVLLVTGWWLPNTLTATRGLWSLGNTIGAEVDTTTSEMRLRTDNTTDGQWTTTGAGLTVGKWSFFAFMLLTHNTGPLGSWRVWAGTVETPPQPVTVTVATSPNGNHTGNANFYVGNKGSGALAFQGDIADATLVYALTTSNTGAAHPFLVESLTAAIADAAAQWTYDTFVVPLWNGDVANVNRSLIGYWHNSLDLLGQYVGYHESDATALNPRATTINGALPSTTNGAPRPYHGMDTLPLRRR